MLALSISVKRQLSLQYLLFETKARLVTFYGYVTAIQRNCLSQGKIVVLERVNTDLMHGTEYYTSKTLTLNQL